MADRPKRSRRDFLRLVAASGGGLILSGSASPRALGPGRDLLPNFTAAPKVPRRMLGKTGIEVPILVLGGGQTFDPRYDRLLHRAFDHGIDLIDTALVYSEGLSQRTVAPFLGQVGRDKVIVLSKGPVEDVTVERFERAIDDCLEQLGTDYLDLYFMHAVDHPRFLDRAYLRAGERLKKSGRTRAFGLSCCGDRMVECMDKAARTGGVDVIMFRYSFARYGDAELNETIDLCRKAGIGLIAMKSQNSVPDDDRHVREFRSENFTLPQAKLKAIWADDRIDTITSLMDNTRKLAENAEAARSTRPLSDEETSQLERIAAASAPFSCQGCAHICESAFDGPVKVARPLRYLMYHECYGQEAHAKRLYARLSPSEKAFEEVDFRAACAACPQGIDIPARLAVARRKLDVRPSA